MNISRHLVIEDQSLREEIWQFYHQHFLPLNEATPLAQSLDRNCFETWMASPKAVKFIARNSGERLAGLAIVSHSLAHDPLMLVSEAFFKKRHPTKKIFHFPAIALSDEFRSKRRASQQLMHAMMAELPQEAVAVFFHSSRLNSGMPRLVRLACHPKVAVEEVDAMACVLCTWANDAGVDSTEVRGIQVESQGASLGTGK